MNSNNIPWILCFIIGVVVVFIFNEGGGIIFFIIGACISNLEEEGNNIDNQKMQDEN